MKSLVKMEFLLIFLLLGLAINIYISCSTTESISFESPALKTDTVKHVMFITLPTGSIEDIADRTPVPYDTPIIILQDNRCTIPGLYRKYPVVSFQPLLNNSYN